MAVFLVTARDIKELLKRTGNKNGKLIARYQALENGSGE